MHEGRVIDIRTLYEMKADWLNLLELMEDGADEEVIADTLESLSYEIEEKADGYAKIITQLNGDVDSISKEIARLSEKKKTLENHISHLKGNLQDTMILTGKEKFKTELFSFGIQSNPPTVVIDDPTSIPSEYLIPQEPKVDKTAIKGYLKDNTATWGHLEVKRGLRIR